MANTWRNTRDEIAALQKDLATDEQIMSQYERAVVGREIKKRIDSNYHQIATGALSAWEKAIADYKAAEAGVEAESVNEVKRWDSSKLLTELRTTRALVDMAAQSKSNDETGSSEAGARLAELYLDAKKSGDIYKQRAVFETLRNLDVDHMPQDAKLKAALLKRQASEDLAALRVTPGQVKAQEGKAAAWQKLAETRDELIVTSKAMGEGDPAFFLAAGTYAKALRRVQIDRSTGEPVIYASDAVEVTGVDMSRMPEGV